MSQTPKRILLIKLGSLGDIFLILGVIRDLAEFSGTKIDVLTQGAYAKVFKRSPDVAQVHIDNRLSRLNLGYLLSLRKTFQDGSYDLIVDFQNSKRTAFYRRWLAPNINWCQLGTLSPSEFSSDQTDSPVLAKFQHQLTAFGIKATNLIEGSLDWLCETSSASERVKFSKKSVVLLPGASARHKHKIWPHYNDLAERLIEQGIDVFVVPGPDDMEQCKAISGELLLNDGNWLNFFQLAGVLKEANFVVGNDSGPTHLAASLGSPGAALFGERTAQYASNMQRKKMVAYIASELSDISVEKISAVINET